MREMLGQKVPDDEIRHLKNGKWCCFVCHWKPIFDTFETLIAHRSSKKHT